MEKTMKNMFLFLCTAVVLTGCAGNENQDYQDGQQIATIDFQDLVQDHDGQNHEIQNHESELSTAANSDTFESDSSLQESTDHTQQNETALDLYAGFIKNEVPAITAPDYPQNDYITYNLEPGKSYTFATLGEYVNKRYLNPEYSKKTTYDDAQYVYLDCPGSSAKNLLVKFSGLGIYAPEDDSYAVYVITEKDGQLYLTDSYECWARSATNACKNGLFTTGGSNGADDQYTGILALLDSGKLADIYGVEILSGWCVSYVSNEDIYNEVFDGNKDIIFTVAIYTIGEKRFYTYDMSECTDDQISVCETYVNRCREEIGIEWVTGEAIEEAIRERCSTLGIDDHALDQMEEAQWVGIK